MTTATVEKADKKASETEPVLRVALVGAGKMGGHHARAISRSQVPARIVAVADPDEDAQASLLQDCPDARGYGTLEDLLAAEEVDVVHVCGPPVTHEPLAIQALQAGCHVYVEKPFATTAAGAEQVCHLAESVGLKVCAGHQLLYEAPTRQARKLMHALGSIVHVESYKSFRTVRRLKTGTPLPSDLQLLDILPHAVYVLLPFLETGGGDHPTQLAQVEIGPRGTVHALIRRGNVTGTLVVTLEGRPVESYLRLIGTNGMLHADFIRSTVQRLIGPGVSTIDKILNPFRLARQLTTSTVASLTRRFVKRQRSFPGLLELIDAFYDAIRTGSPTPVSATSIVETTRICEQIAAHLEQDVHRAPVAIEAQPSTGGVLVTGGTGLLGSEVSKALARGTTRVRVVSRRSPANWERMPGVEYVTADIAEGLPPSSLEGIDTVIHCAAETVGGWDAHQRNSIDATDRVLQAAASAGVKQIIHVSSIAVLATDQDKSALREDTPLEPRTRRRGPYVWGKLESESLARRRAVELGLDLKVVRPGAIVDYRSFTPPGALGRRLGNLFVAVGSPKDRVGVVDLRFAAETLAWVTSHFGAAPPTLNLLEAKLPSKRDLTARLKQSNPDLRVVWLPRVLLVPLSWVAIGLQKVLRPGRPAINAAEVWAPRRYDTTVVARLAAAVNASPRGSE